MTMPTMRAAQFHSYGTVDTIAVSIVPIPKPSNGEILVRVHATTVNGGESAARQGKLRLLSGSRFPKALGIDFAGEVAQVGDGVSDVAVGDRVWGVLAAIRLVVQQQPLGSASDYVVVEADRAAAMPTTVDFVDAATILVGTTAVTALRDVAKVQPGERVLVRGGTGGVGAIGVQLAAAMGGRVTALVSARN